MLPSHNPEHISKSIVGESGGGKRVRDSLGPLVSVAYTLWGVESD